MKDYLERSTSIILLIIDTLFNIYITINLFKSELLSALIVFYSIKLFLSYLFLMYCFNICNGNEYKFKNSFLNFLYLPIRIFLVNHLAFLKKM